MDNPEEDYGEEELDVVYFLSAPSPSGPGGSSKDNSSARYGHWQLFVCGFSSLKPSSVDPYPIGCNADPDPGGKKLPESKLMSFKVYLTYQICFINFTITGIRFYKMSKLKFFSCYGPFWCIFNNNNADPDPHHC